MLFFGQPPLLQLQPHQHTQNLQPTLWNPLGQPKAQNPNRKTESKEKRYINFMKQFVVIKARLMLTLQENVMEAECSIIYQELQALL